MAKPLNVDWNLAQALFIQGVSYKAIAAEVGVTEMALRQRAHRYHWHTLKTESVALASQAVTGHCGKTLVQRAQEVRSTLAVEVAETANAVRETPVKSTLPHLNERAEVASKLANTSAKVFGWGSEVEKPLIVIRQTGRQCARRCPAFARD